VTFVIALGSFILGKRGKNDFCWAETGRNEILFKL
jgi:hypothetical protein